MVQGAGVGGGQDAGADGGRGMKAAPAGHGSGMQIWHTGCRMQMLDATSGMHRAGWGMRGSGAGHGMQDTGHRYRIWDAGCSCRV